MARIETEKEHFCKIVISLNHFSTIKYLFETIFLPHLQYCVDWC